MAKESDEWQRQQIRESSVERWKSPSYRRLHKLKDLMQVGQDQPSFHTQNPIASALQEALAARIRLAARSMITAINLDDEAHPGREEVHDIRANNNLAAKRDAEPLPADGLPEHVLGESRSNAHAASMHPQQ
jgi:hypothetical protein